MAYHTKPTQSLDKWRVDIPAIDDEGRKDCVSTYIPSMIAAKDRFIQLKFLHRAYYTPQRLGRIYHQRDPLCPRCKPETGSIRLMVWSCPKLQPFCQAIADTMAGVCGTLVPLDPLVPMLSHL